MDGIEVPKEDIVVLTISKAISGLPVSGVVKSQLSAEFRSATAFGAGAAAPVRIYIDGQQKYQTFYIYNRKMRAGVISLSCYDRMMHLSRTFDTSTLAADAEGNVPVSSVLLLIAEQCGFSTVANAPDGIGKLSKDDISGVDCEEILSILSAAECGVWYADMTAEGESLGFNRFGATTELVAASAGSYSEIEVGAVKGPIDRLIANSGTETFDTGGSTDFMKILRLNSKLFTAENVNALLSAVENATYTAFDIEHVFTSADAHICCGIQVGEKIYTATKISISIAADGVSVAFGAPDLCEAEFDYTGALNRAINAKVGYNVPSAGTSITKTEGIKIEGDYAVISTANGKMSVYKKGGGGV